MARRRRQPLALAPALALALVAGCLAPLLPDPPPGPPEPLRAVVVASNPLAAEAGAQMLRMGGNAVDAAVAVQMALAVVEPHFSGIGGGTFVLSYNATRGELVALDGRETAPAAATRDMLLLPNGEPVPSALAEQMGYAVGAPGTVLAWHEAWSRDGSLPWSALLAPAIAHAEEGFPVDAHLARQLADAANQQKLRSWPASARQFYKDPVCAPVLPVAGQVACVGGAPYAEGETLRQPDLARTLRHVAESGPDAFYRGDTPAAIADAAAVRQGRISAKDVESYQVVEREPLRLRFGDVELVSMPPPGGGVTVLETLGILEPLAGGAAHQSPHALHNELEAMRLAYADRAAFLGDPAFVDVPAKGLLHPDYLAERRARIDVERAQAHAAGDPWRHEGEGQEAKGEGQLAKGEGRWDDEAQHTSHFVIVDHAGNVVSATTSIESIFGTGMVVPGFGFLLNNHVTDFDARPGGPNEVAPLKRPRSAQSPTIVLKDGVPVAAAGASGGPRIVAAVSQVLLHVLAHDVRVDDAVRAARVYPAPAFPETWWDKDLASDVRAALEARGHDLLDQPRNVANAQAAVRGADGQWVGAADDRAAAGGVVYVEPT